MAIEDDISFLERVPSLQLLGRAALRILAIGSENRTLTAGETLFRAGEAADAAYVVQEGSFHLSTAGDPPNETLAGPGTFLAEYPLIAGGLHAATATAAEPCNVVRISRSLFMKMLEGYPDAARRLRDHMATRAEQTLRELQEVKRVIDPRGGA